MRIAINDQTSYKSRAKINQSNDSPFSKLMGILNQIDFLSYLMKYKASLAPIFNLLKKKPINK